MQTFLELLARNALGALLLAAIVLALMPIVKRPPLRNALWLIVVARLLLPPLWGVPLLPAKESADELAPSNVIEVSATPRETAVAENASGSERTSVAVIRSMEVAPELATSPSPGIETRVPALEVSFGGPLEFDPAVEVPAAAVAAHDRATIPITLTQALFGVWLIGCVLIVTLAFRRIHRFERSLADAVYAPGPVQEQAVNLARKMGIKRCPAVWYVPGRVPPMLWMSGLFARQARLIVPMQLFLRLNTEQRAAILAHELAHLRRGDPWVRWLEMLVVAVYWWFPLLGFIRRRLRESEEQCCDGWVVALLSERKAYATALMETVDYLDRPDIPAVPALASGASPVHNLQRRLTMIMRGSVRGRLSKFGALAVLGVAVGALAFGPAFSSAQQDRPREEKERPGKGEGDRDRERGKDERGKGDRDRPSGEGDPQTKGKERDRPMGEGGFEPKGGGGKDRFQPREGANDLERAREELRKAREESERALQRVREMEERVNNLSNRGRGPGPMGGGGNPMNPMGRGPGPMGGEGIGGRPDGQIQDLQKQLEEMRRMIDELRREINRGPNNPMRNPEPKNTPNRKNPGPNSPFGGSGGGFGGPGGGIGGQGGNPGGNGGGQGGIGGAPGGRGGNLGNPGNPAERLPQPPEKNN